MSLVQRLWNVALKRDLKNEKQDFSDAMQEKSSFGHKMKMNDDGTYSKLKMNEEIETDFTVNYFTRRIESMEKYLKERDDELKIRNASNGFENNFARFVEHQRNVKRY